MEDSLRAMFADRVTHPPVLDDPATLAIRRSRRRRRTRRLQGALASVLAMVVLSSGVVALRDWWEPPAPAFITSPIMPPPAPAVTEPQLWDGTWLGLEVRVINQLWRPDGTRLVLSGTALVEQAHRTPYGLVYGSRAEIRLKQDDGVVRDLVTDPGQWLLSPDAARVAWVTDGVARVASLEPGGLGAPASVEVPEGTAPAGFWEERVVLAGPDSTGFDVWDPDADGWEPAWTDQVAAVYGEAEESLVVLVGAPGAYCVSLVPPDADRLLPEPAECDPPLPPEVTTSGWLTPDGRWLALPAEQELLLVEVAAGEGGRPVATCPRRGRVEPLWWDDTTLLTADAAGAVSCQVDGSSDRLDLPGQVGNRWTYVPSRGTAEQSDRE